jgi:hypothetical protein
MTGRTGRLPEQRSNLPRTYRMISNPQFPPENKKRAFRNRFGNMKA